MRTKVYISDSHDPRVNLALEEMLTRSCQEDEYILYLWQNDHTIVVGRNQNPHREVDLKKVEEDGVTLVRRPSGGGAVFHDLGNLNFTFIAHERHYDQDLNFGIILDALRAFGLEGKFSGRNDLLIEEKKFSGNAYSMHRGIRVHHGTLMLDVDLTKMADYLKVNPLKMQAKGISSVRSRVVNLYDLAPEMTVDSLMEAIIDSFEKKLGGADVLVRLDKKDLVSEDYTDKYFTWQWNLGETPRFSLELEEKFDWGLISIFLDLNKGIIRKAGIYTDSLMDEDFSGLAEALEGMSLRREEVEPLIREKLKDSGLVEDLITWLNTKGIYS